MIPLFSPLNKTQEILAAYKSRKVFIVSHPSIWQLHGSILQSVLSELGCEQTIKLLPSGEEHKTLKQAMDCWEQMAEERFDRNSFVLAFGGGVVSDLAGFVAGCYMRGIEMVTIPTTLLAMIDASIGGKTGVNLGTHKNYVGVFHPSKKIIIDVKILDTLSMREYISGFAEIIKAGMIASPALFNKIDEEWSQLLARESDCLQQVIHWAIEIKEKIILEDPFDRGIRSHLNFGHTFGHALESITDYKQYLHGEAVSIGMQCAARLSHAMGLADLETVEKLKALCQKMGLPAELPPVSRQTFIQLMKKDKKAEEGKINLILPRQIGCVEKICNVSTEQIEAILN